MRDLLDSINVPREPSNGGAMSAAAYALWRFNWIHPFAGGNGRTARALAYLILCIDMGRCVPGIPSIPTRMAAQQQDYIQALRRSDEAGACNISMAVFVGDIVVSALKDYMAIVGPDAEW